MASRSSKVRLKRRVLTKYERGPRTKFAQYDENGNLYCYKCGKYKQPDEFDIGVEKDCWFRSMRDKRCKQCKHEQYLKRRAQNRGKKDLDRILLARYHGMLDRAKAHNLKCDVTLDYLKFLWNLQKGKCALSGIDMTYIFNGGRTPTNISIDKIDSTKGYTMDNIQLVCAACNSVKMDLTEEQMYYFCKNIVKTYESKNNVSTK